MRKSKLTPKRHETIVESIKNGAYAVQAAKAAGISEATYYNWLEQGREAQIKQSAWESYSELEQELYPERKPTWDEKKKIEFLEAIEQAEALAENEAVEIIQQAAKKDWRAAIAYLERKHHERWGQRQHLEANLNGNLSHKTEQLEELSDQELDEVLGGAD